MVETLFNISWGIARLKHKNTIDESEANEAVKIYSNQLKYWSQISEIPVDTSAFIRDKIIEKLTNSSYSLLFEELVKAVCSDSKIAAVYVGNEFRVSENWKLRKVHDMFTKQKQTNVMIVSQSPLELAWEPTYEWNPNKEKFDPKKMETAWTSDESENEKENGKSKSEYEKYVDAQRESISRSLESEKNEKSEKENGSSLPSHTSLPSPNEDKKVLDDNTGSDASEERTITVAASIPIPFLNRGYEDIIPCTSFFDGNGIARPTRR